MGKIQLNFLMFFTINTILFPKKPVQYNGYLISMVDTDGMVLQHLHWPFDVMQQKHDQ